MLQPRRGSWRGFLSVVTTPCRRGHPVSELCFASLGSLKEATLPRYSSSYVAPKESLFEMSVTEMFLEIPIVVTASPLAECFLLDWSVMSPLAMSQVETLDVENQAGAGT